MATPTRPMNAAPTRPMTPAPVKPTVAPAPAPNPAMQRQQEVQAHINKVNAQPGRQGNPLLVDRPAMDAAVNKNMALRQATDARLKAEAVRNTVPASQNKYAPIQRMMNAVQARSSTPVARAKGGKVKSASARADGIAIRGKTRA